MICRTDPRVLMRDKGRNVPDYKRHRLQIQADAIRNVFGHRGIAVHVEASTLYAGFTSFVVEGGGVVADTHSLETALRHRLNCDLLRITRWQGRLLLEIPSLPEPAVNLLELLETLPPMPYVAALGWSEDARPVLLNLSAQDTGHVLLRGEAYAGKTSLLRSSAVSLAMSSRQSQIQMVFVDPRFSGEMGSSGDLGTMQYLPHALHPPVSTVERVARLLAALGDEWRYRRRQRVKNPRIVVFVDRAGELLRRGGAVIEKPLRLLLERGVTSGIHLIMSARASGGDDLDQLTALQPLLRIDGWRGRSQESVAGMEREPVLSRELLGQGDFLASYGEETVRFQAAYLNAYDLHFILEYLQRHRPPPILARPTGARPTLPPGAAPLVEPPLTVGRATMGTNGPAFPS